MIGTDITGTKPLGNSANGIFINGSNSISIGGLAASDGNIIWGERESGIFMSGGVGTTVARGDLIENNFIGVGGPGGSMAIPNANVGVVSAIRTPIASFPI